MLFVMCVYNLGLKLVVNIDQAEYTDQFGQEAGARVVLHPQDRMPFPEDEGILAKPGLLTSVGVRKVDIIIKYVCLICKDSCGWV